MAKQELNYSKAFKEIETIISEIEAENIPVDQLSEKVKRATELLHFCKGKLFKTEEEIEKIFKEMEG